jgi:hypothetical protein
VSDRNELRLAGALAVAASLLAAGCGNGDEEQPFVLRPQQGSFEALSYNVAGLPQGMSSSNPEVNIPLISPLLNGYDLVLAQEDFVYHEELSQQAQHPYQSVPKEIYYAAVHDGLNRFSQFSWTLFERIQWVACYGSATTGSGDCLAEKGFSLARTVFGEGVTFDVYNHHADAGGGAEDIAAREAGFEQLIEYILAHSAGHVVILAGDTNLHDDDPEDVALLDRLKQQTGLADVCEALSCGDDRIDRFFFRDNDVIGLEPVRWQIAEEFVDADGNDLSDHLAVHVGFSWHTK